MDDRETETHSAPPEAAPDASETLEARERMATGMPTLFTSVFVAFVAVAVIILLARYVV